MITGASRGLGLILARELARHAAVAFSAGLRAELGASPVAVTTVVTTVVRGLIRTGSHLDAEFAGRQLLADEITEDPAGLPGKLSASAFGRLLPG